MTEENKSVRKVLVTPAQEKLLALLIHPEAKDYAEALKTVHHLATYYVDPEITDLQASRRMQDLYETIMLIANEKSPFD